MRKESWTLSWVLIAGLTLADLGSRVKACTIFVLTDGTRTLYCNNEDFSNPDTKIWFVPGGTNYFGAVYTGFDNEGWGQGGMNTEGLAYDWVAGFRDEWKRSRGMKSARGNPSMRMLESCRTVDEAIAFFREHYEPSFSEARILVADKSGKSVIIGAENGKLVVEEAVKCRGFGYGHESLAKMLQPETPPTLRNAANILKASVQNGEFATKYSTVYDLGAGEIACFRFEADNEPVRLNLTEELARGPHFYNIANLQEQVKEERKALPSQMQRFYLDQFVPEKESHPRVQKLVLSVMKRAGKGDLREEDFSPELWREIGPNQGQVRKDLAKFGRLKSARRVNNLAGEADDTHRYQLHFTKAVVQQVYRISQDGKRIITSATEAWEYTE